MKQRRRCRGRKPYAGGRRRRRSRRRLGRGSAARRTGAGAGVEAPAPERVSFPQTHRLFQGSLPPGMKPLAERLAGHDVVLLAGAQVFRYHPHIPGPILPPGTRLLHLTDDPDEAARAAAGFSIVGDVRVGLERLAELVPDADRPGPSPRPAPGAPPPTEPMSVGYVFRALASALPRAVVVEESVSSRAAFYDQIRIERTSSYFATGGGGLGFALPAAVGIGLARPGTPWFASPAMGRRCSASMPSGPRPNMRFP